MKPRLSVTAAATAVANAAADPPRIAAPTTTSTSASATVAEVSWSRTGRSATPMAPVVRTPRVAPSHGAVPELGTRAMIRDLYAILAGLVVLLIRS